MGLCRAGTQVLGACLSRNSIFFPALWCSIFPANNPSGVTGAEVGDGGWGGWWCQTEPQVANRLIRFGLNGQNLSTCWRRWCGKSGDLSLLLSLPQPATHFTRIPATSMSRAVEEEGLGGHWDPD